MSSRLKNLKFGLTALATVLGAVLAGSTAYANVYNVAASGSSSDGSLNGSGTITTQNGSVSITLTNLVANLKSAGQELSSIEFTVGGVSLSSTPTLTSQSGTEITISSGGAFTPTGNAPTHWGTGLSGSNQITLETAGTYAQPAKPFDLIIGPPGTGGTYSNANASVIQHNPSIQGTGTFLISDADITSSTTITAASLDFGTGPDHTLTATVTPVTPTPPPSVPEPASLALFGSALAGLGLLLGWQRRRI